MALIPPAPCRAFCLAVLVLACTRTWGAPAESPASLDFRGTMPRHVLTAYLSRAVTAHDILLQPDHWAEHVRFLRETGTRFAGRAVVNWGEETGLASRLAQTRARAAELHAVIPTLIVQAALLENVTPGVGSVAIPGRVFRAFGLTPETRNFRYADMLFRDGTGVDHWGAGSSVPDISQLETRLWFYHLATSFIDAGCEALHLGQMEFIGCRDPGYLHWAATLSLIRDYARTHARRGLVLCDAHVPGGGIVQPDGRLLLDFHSFPLRIREVTGQPMRGELAVGYLDSIYGRSRGGITPSGWSCTSLPYLVEIDNWGASGHEGTPGLPYCWLWGYDEIDWFARQTSDDRAAFLRYATNWLRQTDSAGFLQMPMSRVLHVPLPRPNGAAVGWYFAHRPSAALPDAFGDEDVIRELWR